MNVFRAPRILAIAVVSILIVVPCLATPAHAVARLYTFEGFTSSTYNPAPPNTLPGGQFVSYTFLIDFDGTGSSSLGGVVTPKVDDAEYDYFYVKFVSGTNLYPRPVADPANTFSHNYGFDHSGSYSAGFIFGTPTEYKFNSVVVSSGYKVSEWVVGDSMIGEDSVGSLYLPDGTTLNPDFAWVVSSLELKSISAVPEPATEIARLLVSVKNLPTAVFQNKNMGKALTNKLNAVLSMLDQGNYAEALEKLQNDILGKTDGCAKNGKPDSNDWVKTCVAQSQIYPDVIDIIGLLQEMAN
jgi:hypothetical protein